MARKIVQNEINEYIVKCEEFEEERKMDDVFVTDHQRIEPKRITQNSKEDLDFYEYQKSIDEYNDDSILESKIYGTGHSEYQRNSLLQRILDPFMGAGQDEFGTIHLDLEDRDLSHYKVEDEEKLKNTWENIKEANGVWDVEEELMNIELLKELELRNKDFSIEEFEKVY